MALPDRALPYGLREVKLYPIANDGTVGTAVKLPASRTFTFAEAEDFTELRGDDRVQATRGQGPQVDWDLEGGGISLEAYAAIAGGTVTESGVTPNIKKTYKKKVTNARPYFQVKGRAISDSGGDFHIVVYKCKANDDIGGELSDGEFFLTEASGIGIGNTAEDLYDFIHNETEVALT